MVSPLAHISSAISGQRTAVSQPRTLGFGNGAQPPSAPTAPSGTIINHNMQPFIASNTSSANNMNAIGQTGMYFRGSIVGARVNFLA